MEGLQEGGRGQEEIRPGGRMMEEEGREPPDSNDGRKPLTKEKGSLWNERKDLQTTYPIRG